MCLRETSLCLFYCFCFLFTSTVFSTQRGTRVQWTQPRLCKKKKKARGKLTPLWRTLSRTLLGWWKTKRTISIMSMTWLCNGLTERRCNRTGGRQLVRPNRDIVMMGRGMCAGRSMSNLSSKYLKTSYEMRMWAVKNSTNEQSRSWTPHNRVFLNPWCLSAVYSLGNESHHHWVLLLREWRKMRGREDLGGIFLHLFM